MMAQEYKQIFLAESQEHLLNARTWFSVLAGDPQNRQVLDDLFRCLHSIKGMAASLGYRRMADMAHVMEDGLDRLRRSDSLPKEALGQLYRGLDYLDGKLTDAAAGKPDAADGTDGDGSRGATLHALVIRMPGASCCQWLLLLNELMRLGNLEVCRPDPDAIAGGILPQELEVELRGVVDREQIERRCRKIHENLRITDRTKSISMPALSLQQGVGESTVRIATQVLDRLAGLSGELLTVRHRLQEALRLGQPEAIEGSCQQLDHLLAVLRRQVLDARMVPLETITAPLFRQVRESCRVTGKKIRLNLIGTEVRLDRAILEALSEPLLHMVRNAVDHGIEDSGTITIAARRDHDRITLDVSDDGRGFDMTELVRRARQEGLLPPSREVKLDADQMLKVLCLPGFTTSAAITETSGRGIGMDVVRHTVDKLGGSLEILSGPGEGASFRFILPLTVAILPVLLVESAGRTLGLPLMWIEKTMEVPRQALHPANGGYVADLGPRQLPVFPLAGLLGLSPASKPCASTVVCELRGGHAGLAVDTIIGQKEVYVKPLLFPLDCIPGLTGSTILGDGRVIFLLDPGSLLSSQHGVVFQGETSCI
ncbi:chemotaxis protein CheW [Syntrophotalea acetylenica]|uniref:chemotaxis protein CheA n=1 Tax=Syntrophotalea acetylenica TaxID=29542 RepID=UPI002A3660F5|nr:chemotaxis protein CheW [Syntrophotalea acetylenica]MDY0261748.1 chemotaxis protein CheW [Syntrophotalea acetylenica]